MTPEKQSEGASGQAPEDVLFGGSEPATSNPPEVAEVPAEPTAEPAPANEPPVDGDGDPSSALDDPAPSSALDDKGDGEGDAAPEGAPDAYDFKVPEGASTFGEPVVEAFAGVAKEIGLSQEQAQRVIDALAPAQLDAQRAVVTSTLDGWAKAARTDEEVGGANYKASLANARRAFDRFGTPELKQLLTGENTQLMNHPEVLRFMARVGKQISPDRSLVNGKAPTKPKLDLTKPIDDIDVAAEELFGSVN